MAGVLDLREDAVTARVAGAVVLRPAADHQQVALAAHALGDDLAHARRGVEVVHADPGVVLAALEPPVHQHERLAGLLDGGHAAGQRLERADVHDQAVDALRQQVLDVGVDLGDVAVAVGNEGTHVLRAAFGFQRPDHGDEVRCSHLQRDDADPRLLLLRSSGCCEAEQATKTDE